MWTSNNRIVLASFESSSTQVLWTVRGSETEFQFQNTPKNSVLNCLFRTIHFCTIIMRRSISFLMRKVIFTKLFMITQFDLNLSNCITGTLKIISLKVKNYFSLNFVLILQTIILQISDGKICSMSSNWQINTESFKQTNKHNSGDLPDSNICSLLESRTNRIFPCNCIRGSWGGNIALELIGEDFVTKWPVLIYSLIYLFFCFF